MSRGRRRFLIHVLEKAAVALVVADVVLYFALVRPVRNMRAAEEAEFSVMRNRLRDARARVARLEEFQAEVPGAGEQLDAFLGDHVPTRRQAFSRAARLVRRLTEESGTQLVSIAYKLRQGEDEPLQRLGLDVDVEGPFASVFGFAHALETGNDFVMVRSFTLQPVEGGVLGLRLGADLYLKP